MKNARSVASQLDKLFPFFSQREEETLREDESDHESSLIIS